jgi:hypothetical protein
MLSHPLTVKGAVVLVVVLVVKITLNLFGIEIPILDGLHSTLPAEHPFN